jgi:large subunit ribosomal protein L25
MAEAFLVTEKRTEKGKAAARRFRRNGKVPAILYGDVTPVSLTVNERELERLMKTEQSVINLKLDDQDTQVILREVQYHPVKGRIIHVDFLALAAGHRIDLEVPIHFEGKAAGVKEGGIFTEVKRQLNISVLPKDIPAFLSVQIDNLKMGDTLRVKDVRYENIEILDDSEEVLCKVEQPKTAEAVEAAPAEEGAAEPEVITARRKEEEQ